MSLKKKKQREPYSWGGLNFEWGTKIVQWNIDLIKWGMDNTEHHKKE